MNAAFVHPSSCRRPHFRFVLLLLGASVACPVPGQESPLLTQPPSDSRSGESPNFPGDNLPGGGRNFGRNNSNQMLVFFPPTPPQLGASLNNLNVGQGRLAAPAELVAYVNEPFYAPLSTYLAGQRLRSKLRTRLDDYRAARIAQLGELRGRLDALADADPFTRERELAAFARVQTPRLAALELAADRLREDLVTGGFFEENANWNQSRQWQLGVGGFRSPLEAILAQYQVMRAAVFYQRGLSPAQRRLLREVAMDLAEVTTRLEESGEAAPPPVSADTNPLFYFSPETARLRLPLELGAEVAQKISAYERDKAALKNELRETVYAEDRANFDFLRVRAFTRLAEKQEPQFAALEALADEIRRELALSPTLARLPAPPPLPGAITARITSLLHERKAAQKSLSVLIQQVKSAISVTRIDSTRDATGRAKLSVMISPQDRTEAKVKPVREMVARYNEENMARLAALEKERAGIRDQIAVFVGAGAPGDDPEKSVRDLMDESFSTIERREEWVLYKDYRTALLEPGLSPEQRRLLFDAGLETLELPLPSLDRRFNGSR